MKHKIALVIESSSEGDVWGRVNYDDNLLVESAPSLIALQKRMKKLLVDFHSLNADEIQFDIQYDITGLFEDKNFLNASVIADRAGISRGLMRQYTTGKKYPSKERIVVIQKTIHQIADELRVVKVALPKKRELQIV
ncbi:MAG: hypothetical protein KGL19_01180 [Bacteroidota bacterium]|nr:hypothetical protein [Bacteroidota bacterium]